MKTNTELSNDVQEELSWDPTVRETEIRVAVKDGVVTLTGYVDSFAEKWAAERATKRVSGVKEVVDEIKVRLPSINERTDEEIFGAASHALQWHVYVPHDDINVTVQQGRVTLEGEVDLMYKKLAAEDAVRYLTGVREVINKITVNPGALSQEIKIGIEAAFQRNGNFDATKIKVSAYEGKVTLSGTVRSWAERWEAESVALAAPWVSEVENNITVIV